MNVAPIRKNLRRVRQAVPAIAALLFSLCTAIGSAGEVLAARLSLAPESPFVGQPFTIRLEIEVSPGVDLQDLQLSDIPLDQFATISSYQKEERRQVRHGDSTVDVIPFTATGRATQPARQEFRGTLHARMEEHFNMGIFSSTRSMTTSTRLAPLRLVIRPLPQGNIPSGFQGAIGSFTLTETVEPAQASPGDLINITYCVKGHGWLGDATVILPKPDPNFRIYPVQEIHRDANGNLTLRQVVIPLNTNACIIGASKLPYFDPDTVTYRETTSGPFQLRMGTPQAVNAIPQVKHFDAQPNAPTSAEAGDAAVAMTLLRARKLLPFAGTLLLAMVVVGVLYAWRPVLAIVAGAVLFTSGTYFCHQWSQLDQHGSREVRELVIARLCPSGTSRMLFQVAPGRQVTPQEYYEEWVRIDFDGRFGWIPKQALQP